MSDGQWVDAATHKWAPLITQALTAAHYWQKLSPKQRHLVASCRVATDAGDRVVVDHLVGRLTARTEASLQAKQIVDHRGFLTEVGIYTAMYNLLKWDAEQAKRRANNRAQEAATVAAQR